jgi:hypothetical protein
MGYMMAKTNSAKDQFSKGFKDIPEITEDVNIL